MRFSVLSVASPDELLHLTVSAIIVDVKKFIALVGISLALAACGSANKTTCANQYWDGTVGTCLPAGWHVVDRAGLDQRGVPAEVVVAFQADNPTAGLFATVTVAREPLSRPMQSTEYSDASVLSVQSMPGYEKIDSQKVTLDDQTVALHTFSAQPRTDQPKTRFSQVAIASGPVGYTYTAATPLTVDDAVKAQVELILKSATLKNPEGTK